jgi:VanZ family protein
MLIKNLLVPKYLLFLLALFWTGVITYFCLVQSSAIPTIDIPNLDKCIHTFFHFVFTFVWYLFFLKQLQFVKPAKLLVYSFLLSFVFGLTIELFQEMFTTTRHADAMDVTANLSGAVLAVISIVMSNKFNYLNSILKR